MVLGFNDAEIGSDNNVGENITELDDDTTGKNNGDKRCIVKEGGSHENEMNEGN